MNKLHARKRRAQKSKLIIRESKRPRLVVHRTSAHIYAQIVILGDQGDVVVASSSTIDSKIKSQLTGKKTEKAFQIGKELAVRAKENNITEVAFDRAGYKYHGRIKALADGAREAGLTF